MVKLGMLITVGCSWLWIQSDPGPFDSANPSAAIFGHYQIRGNQGHFAAIDGGTANFAFIDPLRFQFATGRTYQTEQPIQQLSLIHI